MVTFLAVVFGLVCLPGSASAAVITVTTTSDSVAADGQCSLREAVTAANNDAAANGCPAGFGWDTIALGAGTYGLQNGDLVVMNDVTVAGAGAAATSIQQQVNPARIFRVPAGGAALTVQNLTISDGVAPGGTGSNDAAGSNGGSGVDGGSATAGAGGAGQNGGGILYGASNTLTLDHVAMTDNQAGIGANGGNATGGNGGAGAVGGSATGGAGGAGGSGGAVYSVGPVVVIASSFFQNEAGQGGPGGNATGGNGGNGAPGRAGGGGTAGPGGASGSGGAIAAESTVTVQDSVFDHNDTKGAGNGGVGHGGSGGSGNTSSSSGGPGATGNGGNAGIGGNGGAIALITGSAALTVTDTTFTNNVSGGSGTGGAGTGGVGGQAFGAGFVGGFGGNGNGGDGGAAGNGNAIYWGGAATVTRSRFSDNKGNLSGGTGGAGQGGSGGFPSSGSTGQAGGGATGGDGGVGGRGTVVVGSSSNVTNSTFTGNWPGYEGAGGNAAGGNGSGGAASGAATGGNGGAGGTGVLGGLGTLTVRHVTIAGFNANGGGAVGGTALGNGSKTNGSAGAPGASSIRAAGATTLTASVISQNGIPYCSGTITDGGGNIGANGCPGASVDPKLDALQDNGGPTLTMALLSGSPALDIVSASACDAVDQRGVARPHGAACDAGAYERAAPDVVTKDASSVSGDAATLGASITPNGRATTYHFEYGTSTDYGSSTTDAGAGSALAAQDVTAALAGLASATTYHFRIVATSADGTTTSGDRTFTTSAAPTTPAASGDGGPGPGSGTGSDTIAPSFLSASIKPRKFATKGRRAAATFRYALSEGATVKFVIARIAPGRKVGKRCRKPSAKNARKRPCKRYVKAGAFSAQGRAGANSKKFKGRIGKRTLAPGRYRATLTATDAAGNASKPRQLTFQIVKARTRR